MKSCSTCKHSIRRMRGVDTRSLICVANERFPEILAPRAVSDRGRERKYAQHASKCWAYQAKEKAA